MGKKEKGWGQLQLKAFQGSWRQGSSPPSIHWQGDSPLSTHWQGASPPSTPLAQAQLAAGRLSSRPQPTLTSYTPISPPRSSRPPCSHVPYFVAPGARSGPGLLCTAAARQPARQHTFFRAGRCTCTSATAQVCQCNSIHVEVLAVTPWKVTMH
jgi:hypothetical protein